MAAFTFAPDLLVEKVAFVAGGTSGINLGIARAFAAHGARVGILGRNPEKAAAAAAALRTDAKSVVEAFTADVRDPAAYGSALEAARASLGPFDILVNGAAGNFPAPVLGMSPNGFKSVVDIDLVGTFHGCRLGFQHLTGAGAVVINISAPQAFIPSTLQAHVCAAKAGVDMLTRVLALEWGPAGVRVNSIVPGAVDDTEGMSRLTPTPESREKLAHHIPLQRFASADDIAQVALFLASPAAAYVTGAVMVVDGGISVAGMNFQTLLG